MEKLNGQTRTPATNMRFCATWAGPAIFQQRFANNHWLWVDR